MLPELLHTVIMIVLIGTYQKSTLLRGTVKLKK